MALSQFACFFTALHRNTVGVRGGLDPFARTAGGWTPPLPPVALLAVTALVCAAYGWWIVHLDPSALSGRREPDAGATNTAGTSPAPELIGAGPGPGAGPGGQEGP